MPRGRPTATSTRGVQLPSRRRHHRRQRLVSWGGLRGVTVVTPLSSLEGADADRSSRVRPGRLGLRLDGRTRRQECELACMLDGRLLGPRGRIYSPRRPIPDRVDARLLCPAISAFLLAVRGGLYGGLADSLT